MITMELGMLPVALLLLAGAGIGAFVFVAILWQVYLRSSTARHSYMAKALRICEHEIDELRKRHDDKEPVDEYIDSFPNKGKIYKVMTVLLDWVYAPITTKPRYEYREGRR